jgi:hypothetical protein
MAIPRPLLVLGISAAAAGVVLLVSNRLRIEQQRGRERKKSPIDEADEAKEQAASKKDSAGGSSGEAEGAAAPATAPGAATELALFLAGDAWHDEIGWQSLWEKDSVNSPDGWLREQGTAVLAAERKKLTDHPALLAGCRRRWIVVCRYAGIDVADAAGLWNDTAA